MEDVWSLGCLAVGSKSIEGICSAKPMGRGLIGGGVM